MRISYIKLAFLTREKIKMSSLARLLQELPYFDTIVKIFNILKENTFTKRMSTI